MYKKKSGLDAFDNGRNRDSINWYFLINTVAVAPGIYCYNLFIMSKICGFD